MPQHKEHKVKLDGLTEFPGNPRTHSDQQVDELVRSLELFGQYRPLVLDEDRQIMAGNGMYLAMLKLGWKEAKGLTLTGLSDGEKRKLVLADNRLGAMGGTDFYAVDKMLEEIGDYEVPGYDPEALRQLLASAEESLEVAEEYGTLPEQSVEKALAGDPVPEGSTEVDYSQPLHEPTKTMSGAEGNGNGQLSSLSSAAPGFNEPEPVEYADADPETQARQVAQNFLTMMGNLGYGTDEALDFVREAAS